MHTDELRDEVKESPWNDMESRINDGVELWRTCFPRAIGANLFQRIDHTAGDCDHLRGYPAFEFFRQQQKSWKVPVSIVFPFEHIHGIQSLAITGCTQMLLLLISRVFAAFSCWNSTKPSLQMSPFLSEGHL